DGRGEAIPVGGLFFKLLAAEPRQRIELGSAVILARLPLSLYPPLLLKLLQGWVKRSVADLQQVAGDLFQALPDRPAVERLKRQDLQDQEVQGSLDQICRFAHVILLGYRGEYKAIPLGKQGVKSREGRSSNRKPPMLTLPSPIQ